LNKIRRIAEQLVERYPTLFSSDFEKNKHALATVSVVHTRSLRNQLAGAITKLVRERGPIASETSEEPELEPSQEPSLEDRLLAERREAPEQAQSSESPQAASAASEASKSSEQEGSGRKQEISQAAV
jgi:small subunit ribosomal protein S17e